jgi:quinol monooxygenase YgiN
VRSEPWEFLNNNSRKGAEAQNATAFLKDFFVFAEEDFPGRRYFSGKAHGSGGMIVSTTRITVSPEKRIELFQTVGRLLAPINAVKGCRRFYFYVDTVDENSSLLLSEWDTETDLNEYLRSNDFAILNGAITVLSTNRVDSKALVTSQTHDPEFTTRTNLGRCAVNWADGARGKQ